MSLLKRFSKPGKEKPEKPVKEKRAKAVKEKVAKEGKGKAPKRKFLKGARYVLFVGDEGTILLYIKNNVVQTRQFVPDASEQNLEELRTSLNKDTNAPLSMVLDSMDQSYVQQSLPPVSSMSVKKLIKHRLDRDFGANDIKGAILLGRESAGRKDWNFLMVSIEKSRQLAMWLDFVYGLPNRFLGIYLVSVETEVIVKKLEQAMGVPKAGTGSKWKFFVSHNKVGGFRQVILHNNRIIFTRMAQPIGEFTPEVIAGNIEQEMLNTIEYMKRLSFAPEAGLDIYIVASSSIKTLIDQSKFKTKNFHILTPYEVAGYLGIEGATQPADQFGDVILAASISSSPKHVLTLSTPESRKFTTMYNAYLTQRWVGALLLMGILGYAGSIASDIYFHYVDSDELAQTKRQHQNALDSLKEEIKKSNIDVEKSADILDLYQLLQKQKVSPLAFIARIESVIKLPIAVKSIEWSAEGKSASIVSAAAPKMVATFALEFPGVSDPESWQIVSKKILSDLKALFKGYDIAFGKIPSRFIGNDKIDVTFDSTAPAPSAAAAASNTTSEVELTIKEP